MVLFAAGGCTGGIPIGQVQGKVTLDGRPLASGCLVNFMPKSSGAEIGCGITHGDGSFSAFRGEEPGLPVGEYQVIILPPAQDPQEFVEQERKNMQIVFTAIAVGNKALLENLAMPQAKIVPQKYWVETTSGLRVVVQRGQNLADFALTTDEN